MLPRKLRSCTDRSGWWMQNAIWQARFAPIAERAPELRRLSRPHARADLPRCHSIRTLCDDRCLTLIQRFEKSADPIGEIFPAGQFERRLRLCTWNVSQNSVMSSSPTNASSDSGRRPTRFDRASFFSAAIPSSSLSSSSVGRGRDRC